VPRATSAARSGTSASASSGVGPGDPSSFGHHGLVLDEVVGEREVQQHREPPGDRGRAGTRAATSSRCSHIGAGAIAASSAWTMRTSAGATSAGSRSGTPVELDAGVAASASARHRTATTPGATEVPTGPSASSRSVHASPSSCRERPDATERHQDHVVESCQHGGDGREQVAQPLRRGRQRERPTQAQRARCAGTQPQAGVRRGGPPRAPSAPRGIGPGRGAGRDRPRCPSTSRHTFVAHGVEVGHGGQLIDQRAPAEPGLEHLEVVLPAVERSGREILCGAAPSSSSPAPSTSTSGEPDQREVLADATAASTSVPQRSTRSSATGASTRSSEQLSGRRPAQHEAASRRRLAGRVAQRELAEPDRGLVGHVPGAERPPRPG